MTPPDRSAASRGRRPATARRTAGATSAWAGDRRPHSTASTTRRADESGSSPAGTARGILSRPRVQLLRHVFLQQDDVFEHERVHFGAEETAIRVLGRADDRLAADVEAGVDEHRATGRCWNACSSFVSAGCGSSSTSGSARCSRRASPPGCRTAECSRGCADRDRSPSSRAGRP